ncbi:MAG TPA: zinc ABC transporter substrate-binding protein [Gammaproteobacteria bacterium]|nr:zinc ABC transporter substrate-binding protein [Gammaproteobacteria bacterium]
MMNIKKYAGLLFISLMAMNLYAAPKVVVTIAPIHALTTALMQGVAEPVLLVAPNASPHNYALKPSQVSDLYAAQLVIWVGESLETFLIKPLQQLPPKITILGLLTTAGLNPLPFRVGPTWQQESDHHHHHAGLDPHIWLDPQRMQTIATAVTAALVKLDSDNKQHYETNAATVKQQLTTLDQQLATLLRPIHNQPFIVFHEAYQYFEQRYQLKAVGAITLNPEIMPSAKRVAAIQVMIKQQKVICIFSEPQFRPAIVDRIAEGTGVKVGVLDPVGVTGQGFAAYAQLLTNLATSLRGCLLPT